mmetsp:Transcript_51930/g.121551  ORF Transcript_51930/g.121551 Transcript_51930/m.121551 type:complete len:141 (+) Transcript_51930:496-918(+)
MMVAREVVGIMITEVAVVTEKGPEIETEVIEIEGIVETGEIVEIEAEIEAEIVAIEAEIEERIGMTETGETEAIAIGTVIEGEMEMKRIVDVIAVEAAGEETEARAEVQSARGVRAAVERTKRKVAMTLSGRLPVARLPK